MSVRIPVNDLSNTALKYIENHLVIKDYIVKSSFKQKKFVNNNEIECFSIREIPNNNNQFTKFIYLPMGYANDYFNTFKLNKKKDFPKANDYSFNLTLNPVQNEIKNETYDILNRNKSILIQLYTGCGKSYYAIYLAFKLKYITMVLCHRLSIIDQWHKSILTACPDAKVQIVEGGDKLLENIDFYIMNITNVPKKSEKMYSHIGLLIVDEAHTQATDTAIQNILMFEPKYLIGLTATPEAVKNNSLHLLYGNEWIIRKMNRPFNAYIVNSKFVPKVENNDNGDINWNSVLTDQARSQDFNHLILKIINYFRFRKPFVLCKRKEQTMFLYNKLIEDYKIPKNEVEIYIGTARKYNHNASIFLSTFSKSGCGFDAPEYDTFINASDVCESFIQYLGRVFRKPYTIPIVIDITCNNPIMKRHLTERKKIYNNSGGQIKCISVFPELFENIKEFVSKSKIKN
jgi:superfamily II DNA or RNA helicase